MAEKKKKKLKTFNLDEGIYKNFSEHCKKNGISMSKRVENFMKSELEKLRINTGNIEMKKANEEHSFKKYC